MSGRAVSGRARGHGQEKPPDAQEILLIHDHPGSPTMWARVDLQLRRLGLAVHSVRWPSDSPETVTAAEGWRLPRLLERPSGTPIVVVAHGFGAITALALAAASPEHVGAVVLVAPVPIPRSVLGVRRTTRYGAAQVRVRCPAVLVAGARDTVSGSRAVRALVRLLPQSQRIDTEAGHLIPLQDPDAVVRAVMCGLARSYQQSLHIGGPHRPVPTPRSRTPR